MRNRIELPHGCNCSTPSIYPKNWKSCNKSALTLSWRIQYYFYDPNRSKPTSPIVVKGMNVFNDLESRRNATKLILDDELKALRNGYNPYEKNFNPEPIYPAGSLNPELRIIEALRLAFEKLERSKVYMNNVRIAIDRLEKALKKLYINKPIKDFRRSELREAMDVMKLPDVSFNMFKAYYSSLYNILLEYECVETNITRDIRKKQTIKKQREVLSYENVMLILNHLKNSYPDFYRYAMIFFLSGGRSSELFSLKIKDVNLENQEYKVLIKKGKQYKVETKIIIKSALPFWTDIVQKSNSKEDYLFSFGLVPGPTQNNPKQITIRWREQVKQKIAIKDNEILKKGTAGSVEISADFYSLKHTFLDYLDANVKIIDFNSAQSMASHTTSAITHGVYTVGKKKRENEILKQISI